MGAKKKYKVYKKGGESFKPHMMYNPETGEGFMAQQYQDHLRMDNMGYGHEPMMRMGGMPCYECGGGIHFQAGGTTPEYNKLKAYHEKMRQAYGTNDTATLNANKLNGAYNANDLSGDYGELMRLLKQQDLSWYDRLGEEAAATFPHVGQQIRGTVNQIAGTHFKQGGGTSTAPQNTSTDTIGQQRQDLMKNYMAGNIYMNMLDEEQQRIQDNIQNYFQSGGSTYNPNLYGQQAYASALDAQKKQFKKDVKGFGKALINTAAIIDQHRGMNQQQQPQNKPLNFSPQSMDAMPNTGFGSKQPDTFGRNTDQSFGQGNPMTLGADFNKPVGGFNPNLYMAYGGDLPMAQNGDNWQPARYNPQTGIYQASDLPEFEVKPRGFMDYWNPLGYDQAAAADRAREARNARFNPSPSPLSYGKQLKKDVPTRPALMYELYPNASSAEIPGGMNWNEYNAEQERLAQLIKPGYGVMQIDPAGSIGASLQKSGFIMTPEGPMLPWMIPPSTQSDTKTTTGATTTTKPKEDKAYWDNVNEKAKKKVSQETQNKANQSTKGKTPTERKEIEAAKEQVNKAKEEAIKESQPNYTETKGDKVVTTDGQTYYTQQPQAGFYGGPGFKYKVRGSYIDPETGKRVRVREKSKSPTGGDFFGFGRSGSPRKIKNTYNIYNNPYMYQMPGATTTTTPAAENTGLTPEQIAGRAAEEQYGQYLRAMQDDTATAEAQEAADMEAMMDQYYIQNAPMGRVQPRGLMADQYNPQPIPVERSMRTKADYMNLPSMQEMGNSGAAVYNIMNNPELFNTLSNIPMPNFGYGGYIPMAQMGLNNQFSEERYGTFLDDANAAVSQSFTQPASTLESTYTSGPDSGSYVEDGKVMVYGDKPKRAGQVKEKVKRKGTGMGSAIAGELALPTLNFISGLAENAQMQEPLTDVNQFWTVGGMQQGPFDINKGQVVDTVYAQDSGNYGAANVKYGGGMPEYRDGGVYDLTPDEIKQILAMGGSIEYM